MKENQPSRSLYVIVLIVSVIAVAFVVGAGTLSARAGKRQVDFPVRSAVPKLTILDVKLKNDRVHLTLRNDYEKPITAFAVAEGGVISRHELIDSDRTISPGQVIDEKCAIPSASATERAITVLAAILEDGSTHGIPKFVDQIVDARAGRQAQLARFLEILETDSLSTASSVS